MSSDLLEYIFLCSHYSDISKMNLLFSLIFYLDSLLNHVQFIDYILSLIFTSLFPQTSGFSIVLILDGSLEYGAHAWSVLLLNITRLPSYASNVF